MEVLEQAKDDESLDELQAHIVGQFFAENNIITSNWSRKEMKPLVDISHLAFDKIC